MFTDTTDRHEYAKKVVSQSLSPRPFAWFFYGKTTLIVRFLETFGFRTAWVSALVHSRGRKYTS